MSEERGIEHSFQNDHLVSLDDSGNSEQILLAANNSQSDAEDITLEVGPENTPFQAQRHIPAIGNPPFEVMFYGPLADHRDKTTSISPETMPDGFKDLLKHLCENITLIENKMEALNACIETDKYQIPKLKEDCKNFCSFPLSSSNIWKLLERANTLSLMPLVSRCKQYLENHTDLSLLDDSFLEIKTETVIQILNMSCINVGEYILLRSVINWGKHKVNTEKGFSLAGVLKPLMPYIRFGALTPLEFCKFLDESNNVLEKHDALAILKHLTKPLTYTLPKWCCVTHSQRVCISSSVSYSSIQNLEQRKGAKKLKTRH